MSGLAVLALLASWLLPVSSASAEPSLYLPYWAGTSFEVTQGNNGSTSHFGTFGTYAIDFGVPDNTPVLASAAGRVVRAQGGCPNYRQDGCNGGLGNYLVIEHSSGFCTQYAHLRSFTVTSGSVSAAQEIGRSGNSGWSTGPHLDFRRTGCDSVSRAFKFVEYSGSYEDSAISGRYLTSLNTGSGTLTSELLLYNRNTGTRYLYDFGSSGGLNKIWGPSTSWLAGWDIIPVETDRTAGSELLLYNRNTGTRYLYDFGSSGGLNKIWGPSTSWSAGWDIIPVETDRT